MSVRKILARTSLGFPVFAGSIALFVLALVLPMFLGTFEINLLTTMLILAVYGLGFNIAFGFTNLPSFGHAAFYGLGAYGFALTFEYLTPNGIVLGIIISLLAVIAAGFLMGTAALRGRGIYFALITFAFAQFLYEVAFRFTEFTGGDDGVLVTVPEVFGITIAGPENVYYISLILLALVTIGTYRLLNSPFGRVMKGIRRNPDRTAAIGYPVKRIQLSVFTISATISGLSGILLIFKNQFVTPSTLFWQQSVDAIIIAIIGGSTTLFGPIVGAIFLVGTRELLRGLANVGTIITGIIFIFIIIFASDGIVGYIQKFFKNR